MTAQRTVSAVMGPSLLAMVANSAGLVGATRSQVMRYVALRITGMPVDDARRTVLPTRNLSEFNESGYEPDSTKVPHDIVDQIRKAHPDKSLSWTLRYQAAKEAGASETIAVSIADGFNELTGFSLGKAGRPQGSKDSYQRTRRTKTELTELADES